MACFIAPATEAIVTTIVKKTTDKKETHNPFIKRLNWLNNMLWGGSALLAFEHVWHGEIVPWAPFLTNGLSAVREIATTGVTMAVAVTAVWAGVVAVTNSMAKRPTELIKSNSQ